MSWLKKHKIIKNNLIVLICAVPVAIALEHIGFDTFYYWMGYGIAVLAYLVVFIIRGRANNKKAEA